MANQILSMNKLKEVLRYQIEGRSNREISKRTELSRNTVEKYLIIFDSHPLSFKELVKLSDSELHSIVIQPVDSKPQWESLYALFPSMETELKRFNVKCQCHIAREASLIRSSLQRTRFSTKIPYLQ
jgi:hypothetical protein